jgi:hypothetical protein
LILCREFPQQRFERFGKDQDPKKEPADDGPRDPEVDEKELDRPRVFSQIADNEWREVTNPEEHRLDETHSSLPFDFLSE